MKTKEALWIMLGATLVLAACAVLLFVNKPHAKVEDRKAISITAAELNAAYQRNETAANARYLNKALEVSGKLSGIERNQDGGSMLLLDSGSPDSPVQCSMRDAMKALPATGDVRIKGFCAGSNLSGVTLTDCIVALN